jgi:hypothetical protein
LIVKARVGMLEERPGAVIKRLIAMVGELADRGAL